MFTLSNLIMNEGMSSFINEVCFHPNGEMFGATYEHKDEVVLYDARDLSVIKVLGKPGAAFIKPHGILITEKHVIVTNKGTSPGRIDIFRLDDDSGTPVQSYTTPYSHLQEGHSLALNGNRLVVTYCEGRAKKGALVSYEYDDESGQIIRPLDIQEKWYRRHGDAKGVCFDPTGEKVWVTFQSNIPRWSRRGIWETAKNVGTFGRKGATTTNGIAIFGIDQQGRFTRAPIWKKVFRRYCRLENIHICGNYAVVTNADGGCVELYDLSTDRPFETPIQVLSDPLVFPHGAKLSPDGKQLLVSCNGIVIVDHKVKWKQFVTPRKDCVAVFKLQAA